MVMIRWWWTDGSVDEFRVDNMKQAESMAQKLYRNPDIVLVEYEED